MKRFRPVILLILPLFFAAFPAGAIPGPKVEIILDCSAAMTEAEAGSPARIALAWRALGSFLHKHGGTGRAVGSPDSAGPARPAILLRLAGGSGESEDQPCGRTRLLRNETGEPFPCWPPADAAPPPVTGGLLPLVSSLEAATADLDDGERASPASIILIAAGWEGCADNPGATIRRLRTRDPELQLHVLALSPGPTEAEQLRRLAGQPGCVYYPAATLEEIEQGLALLAAPGELKFTVAHESGSPAPDGATVRLRDQAGLLSLDMNYAEWVDRGAGLRLPAGTYELGLSCPRKAEPFQLATVEVESGRISRPDPLVLPDRGRCLVRLLTARDEPREECPVFNFQNEAGKPVSRMIDCRQTELLLYPGKYTVRVLPYGKLGSYGTLVRRFTVESGTDSIIDVELPPEGKLRLVPVKKGRSQGAATLSIKLFDDQGELIWRGKPPATLTLPEGRYGIGYPRTGRSAPKVKKVKIGGGDEKTVEIKVP